MDGWMDGWMDLTSSLFDVGKRRKFNPSWTFALDFNPNNPALNIRTPPDASLNSQKDILL
jgi:hypothetical protein